MNKFKEFLEQTEELSEAKLGPEQAVKELMDLRAVLKDLEENVDDILELSPVKRRGLANKAHEITKVLMTL